MKCLKITQKMTLNPKMTYFRQQETSLWFLRLLLRRRLPLGGGRVGGAAEAEFEADVGPPPPDLELRRFGGGISESKSIGWTFIESNNVICKTIQIKLSILFVMNKLCEIFSLCLYFSVIDLFFNWHKFILVGYERKPWTFVLCFFHPRLSN